MCLTACQKLFLFSSYVNFCPKFFGHVEKWLDEISFKIYDATDWETTTSSPEQFKKNNPGTA